MVAVFREVKRVLRSDGTVWLNMGDSYNGSGGAGGDYNEGGLKEGQPRYPGRKIGTLKPKDLCGIPWRVAFALQADGWWLRSDIIWSKPNPMPESVTDRPTKAHEYLFLLTKSARYYYDNDAVREPHIQSEIRKRPSPPPHDRGDQRQFKRQGLHDYLHPSGRNRRTVWHIATAPYSGAHFATYPPALVEPCIKAGTSERGVCPECGAPWERVVDSKPATSKDCPKTQAAHEARGGTGIPVGTVGKSGSGRVEGYITTLGWQPTCDHDGTITPRHEPVPATVFDPFAGSGTTLQVARALGRSGIGLDLSMEYLELACQRLQADALKAWYEGEPKKDGKAVTDLPLFKEST